MFNAQRELTNHIKPMSYVLVLSLLGFLLNLYPVGLFANIHLILGNVAFIIVAMRFGVTYSLLSAIIVNTSLWMVFGHPYGFLVFTLEAVTVSFLRRRGWYILYADLLYWLCIGMPLTAAIIISITDFSQPLALLTTIKQGFNGLVCTTLAGLIVYLFPKPFNVSFRQQPELLRTLKSQLIYITSLVISFSIITTSLFVSLHVVDTMHETIEQRIEDHKVVMLREGNMEIVVQQNAINLAINSINLADYDQDKIHQVLNLYLNTYPVISSTFIANKAGKTLHKSIRNEQLLNLQTHPPKSEQLKGYVDEVIKQDKVKYFALFKEDNKSYYLMGKRLSEAGNRVLFNIIDLSLFEGLIPQHSQSVMDFVITNKDENIIISSPRFKHFSGHVFSFKASPDLTFKSLERVSVQERIDGPYQKDYYLSQATLLNGWVLYVMYDTNSVIEKVEREFVLIFLLLFLSLFISISLTTRIGSELTKPLKFIFRQLNKFNNRNEMSFKPLYKNMAVEIHDLYDELQRSKGQIINHQLELEQIVEERTLALQEANEQLRRQAQKDGLTNIYNRRYFDENFRFHQKIAWRNKRNIALVLLDIDHFKRVNDTHGHIVGDECLRILSVILKQHFSRETDLIARYGGEEFVLVLTDINSHQLERKLENLRKAVEHRAIIAEDGSTFCLTISIGALVANASFANDAEDWVKVADLCLYKAKKSGRNQVKIENFSKYLSLET
ncbi:diguanylate cyclase [Thalassotalea aquiviva]|uniref:diguanylate cyclase n=1 Tax=Thalassotalea aquiviva TaxID=3242415 RepID=UPI00352B4486